MIEHDFVNTNKLNSATPQKNVFVCMIIYINFGA